MSGELIAGDSLTNERLQATLEQWREAGQRALEALIEWYVQEQGRVLGIEQARAACLRECGAARRLAEMLGRDD